MGGRSESWTQSYAAIPGSWDETLQFSRQEALAKARIHYPVSGTGSTDAMVLASPG